MVSTRNSSDLAQGGPSFESQGCTLFRTRPRDSLCALINRCNATGMSLIEDPLAMAQHDLSYFLSKFNDMELLSFRIQYAKKS